VVSSYGSARDNRLLDAIDALPTSSFIGSVWRVVREGRDPLQCSAVGGRWDDRSFDVLYTAATGDGAVAEMYFHLSRGQPVVPSQVRYRLFELSVKLATCIRFPTLEKLTALGLQTSAFGQLSYMERHQEYPRTQEIAEVAHFLGRDGLIVPSARSSAENVIIYCDHVTPDCLEVIKNHNIIRWDAWRQKPFGF
jgi:RES domain-containing protein